jgi:hypothetical protein
MLCKSFYKNNDLIKENKEMLVNIENYKLKTYSNDLICVQKGDDTLCSSVDIRICLNYLEEIGFKEVKNRVEDVLLDIDTLSFAVDTKSLETKNYTVLKTTNKEFTIRDKYKKNNCRWIYNPRKLIDKLYSLEVNRLKCTSLNNLVADIELLNNDFNKIIGKIK